MNPRTDELHPQLVLSFLRWEKSEVSILGFISLKDTLKGQQIGRYNLVKLKVHTVKSSKPYSNSKHNFH